MCGSGRAVFLWPKPGDSITRHPGYHSPMNAIMERSILLQSFHSLILTLLVVHPGFADGVGSIRGVVRDAVTQEPMPYAVVMVLETDFGVETDEQGRFEIDEVPAGTYRLQAAIIGHTPRIKTDVVVAPGHSEEVVFELEPSFIEVAGIEIKPEYFSRRSDEVTSSQSFSNEEIRRAPGGFEDVVKAISVLPGVVQAQNGRNDLIVRGGAPSENLYVVENVEIPNINHFGTQGATGGPLSFINLDFINDVTFSTGGFGVQHGDKLSSVMQIDLADGRRDRIGGKATISATQFGMNLEGPIDTQGSFVASARRSYLDWIFRAADFAFVPEYWDFLGKGTYRFDSRNDLTFTGIGVIDNIRLFNDNADQRYDNSRILANSQDQIHGLASWRRLFSGGFVTTSVGQTTVDYDFLQNDSLLNPLLISDSRESETSLRSDAVIELKHGSQFSFGAQGKLADLNGSMFVNNIKTTFGDTIDIDRSWNDNGFKSALYAQYAARPAPRFSLSVGARVDHFDMIEEKLAFGPRLAISYDLTQRVKLSLAGGRYQQSPSYIWLVTNRENRRLKHVQADQLVVGVERLLRDDTRVRVEGYVKRYDNYAASLEREYLVLANSGAGWGGAEEGFTSFGFDPLSSDGTGLSRGLEFLIQKRLSDIRCYGIASFTLSQTDFEARDGISRPGSFDQRVILNLSGGYKPNKVWEYSTKFRLGSGTPYTPFNVDGSQDATRYNDNRLPVFHALDVRIDRRWNFSTWNLITYLDVQNVYGNKPVSGYRWNAREQKVEADEDAIGILPSIGISAEF